MHACKKGQVENQKCKVETKNEFNFALLVFNLAFLPQPKQDTHTHARTRTCGKHTQEQPSHVLAQLYACEDMGHMSFRFAALTSPTRSPLLAAP